MGPIRIKVESRADSAGSYFHVMLTGAKVLGAMGNIVTAKEDLREAVETVVARLKALRVFTRNYNLRCGVACKTTRDQIVSEG